MKIAIATCFNIPEPDVDESITLEAFERRGYEVHLTAWEDPSVDWSDFDGVIVRSTWNYPVNVDLFVQWIRTVDSKTTLLNPASIILANINKRYLTNLARQGLPVVSTHWFLSGEASCLHDHVQTKFVIKPAIGAGSMDTRVFEVNQIEVAIAWLHRFPETTEFMVQEYLNSVNTIGEQSIIVIGKNPSHRIVKHPRFDGQDERVDGPFEVGEFEAFARKVIEPIKNQILYARIDLMLDNEGDWRLSELELIEPSLFFTHNPGALDDFVDSAELMLS